MDSRPATSPSQVVGATPPRAARPVSLAVREYFLRHLLAPKQERSTPAGVIFAVSGGADSLALTVAGADVAQRHDVPYAAAIVDHRMREDSAQEAEVVANRLRDLGLKNVSVLHDPNWNARDLREAPARELRHRLLEDLAQKVREREDLHEVDVLYAHTLDDQAETVLMRLGRGASPRALAGMHPRTPTERDGVYRGRPLLGLRRRNTEGFCESLGLTWVEDPTNSWEGTWRAASGAPLPRTSLRHRVIPALARALGQDPVPALGRVAELLQEDEEALAQIAQAVFAEAIAIEPDRARAPSAPTGAIVVNAAGMLPHPSAIRSRVYLRAWEEMAHLVSRGKSSDPLTTEPLSHAHLRAIDQLVMNRPDGSPPPTGSRVDLPGGVQARRKRDYVEIVRLSRA